MTMIMPSQRIVLRLIPEISDEEILEMLDIMKPVYLSSGCYSEIIVTQVDLRSTAYTWSPNLGEPVELYTDFAQKILTYHSYGAPSLFKPSLAEVCAQIRSAVSDWRLIRFFHLSPCEASESPIASAMLNEGYHIALCTLFQ